MWFTSTAMGTTALLLPRHKPVKTLAPVLFKADGVGRSADMSAGCRRVDDLRAGARSMLQFHVFRLVLRASFINKVGIH